MSGAEVAPVRPDEVLPWDRLEAWLKSAIPGLAGPMEPLQFPGGSANLTYLMRFPEAPPHLRDLVVRRPPLGPVAPGAHDMGREYKALRGLAPVFDRAPRAHAFCEDVDVVGAPFLVMERRTGVVIRKSIPEPMRHWPRVERRASFALVDAMADFHALDPETIGLSSLGKPEGFVERQVHGWKKRWDRAKDRDIALCEEVYDRLARTLPAPQAVSLVHNDLKLDNCQFDPADPDRVKSIFDWDMTTVGDPLIDLGTLLGYWADPGESAAATSSRIPNDGSFPTRREIAAHYAGRSPLDLSGIDWYEAFALWKTAVVIQQIYIRFKLGQTQDQRFADMGERVIGQLELAHEVLRRT